MSNIFWKYFHLCFFGFKYCQPSVGAPAGEERGHPLPPPAAPEAASARSLIRTFNSLYDLTSASSSKSFTLSSDDFFSSSEPEDTDAESTPDLATVFASQRFFFSSPGRSNSIMESPESRAEMEGVVGEGVAVPTYSPDPVEDFRRSMMEMIQAREPGDDRSDVEYLHKLLLCYLTLNPKRNHKYIIKAFTDLLVSLLSPSDSQQHAKHRHSPVSPRSV